MKIKASSNVKILRDKVVDVVDVVVVAVVVDSVVFNVEVVVKSVDRVVVKEVDGKFVVFVKVEAAVEDKGVVVGELVVADDVLNVVV